VLGLALICGSAVRNAVKEARDGFGAAGSVAAVCGFLVGGFAACFAFTGLFQICSRFGMPPEAGMWVTLGVFGTATITARINLYRGQNSSVQEVS
jgi:hypothetical protein